jgi:hypothetical protein
MRYAKFIILAVLAFAAFKVAFYLMDEGGSDEQTGNLRVVDRIVNVGTAVVNQGTSFTMSMHNSGQKPIKLTRFDKTCGCIDVSVPKDTCQPGETISANGTITPHAPGSFRYAVTFYEEDNSVPGHRVEVVGKAVAGAGSAPQSNSTNP